MSTSSTSSTSDTASHVSREPDKSFHTNRRNPVAPVVTRGRWNSAPPVMRSTPAKNASCTDEELAQLLADICEETAEKMRSAPLPPLKAAFDARDEVDEELDREIDRLFSTRLAEAIAQVDEASMLRELAMLIPMFRHAQGAMRKDALSQVIPLLNRTCGSKEAVRIAISMIDEFVAAHERAEKEATNADAEMFINAMHAAVVAYPLAAKCQLVVYELWGAEKLESITMARTSTDLLSNEIRSANDDTTARRIEQAVDYIATMPLKYRLTAAIGLYRCVPDAAACKLRALEAIAQKNLDLPDTLEGRDFSKIVNQQIYELRLEAE